MANYNKQFNFRNGVQVDNDNFVVTPTGLVGIGTTIPTESLHVADGGNVKVSGSLTATSIFAETLTITGGDGVTVDTGSFETIVGGGVSIKSGIVTADTTSGIVTYYGDATYLQGMPTSQWVDIDAGLGYTSIYATGNVGVATVDPRFAFQVGGNTDTTVVGFSSGVGISSSGDVLITGVTTSGSFVGNGSSITNLNAGNITSGTISNDRLPVLEDSKIPNNFEVTGVITATTFDGNLVGTGVSAGIVTASTRFEGTLVGIASTALSLSGTPNIKVGIVTATEFKGPLTGTASTAESLTQDAVVNIDQIKVGLSTVETSIGIGTDHLTGFVAIGGDRIGSSDISINRSNNGNTPLADASIKVWSDLGQSTITIGTSESDIGKNAQIRYAFRGLGFPFSGDEDLDIINNGNGNINYYLQAGTVGVNTGGFHWHRQSSKLLSLTHEGNLGIGITNPEYRLHVSGISTFTDDVGMNEDLNVYGNLYVGGTITFGTESLLSVDVGGDVKSADGNETVVRIPSNGLDPVENAELRGRIVGGASTISKLSVTGIGQDYPILKVRSNASSAGVATDVVIDVNNAPETKFVVTELGKVGIGTTNPKDCLDAKFARRPVTFPNMTSSYRDSIQNLSPGSTIYNTDNNKLQVYNGSTWNDCF